MCLVANGSTHLSTWVTAETKQRFSVLAREFGLSESALLKRSITLMLRSTAPPEVEIATEPMSVPRGLRVYVRLKADDHWLLSERAKARGMAAATYASFLLRSHLRALAPLPDRELAALTAAVAELGAIGRNINQIARREPHRPRRRTPHGGPLRVASRAGMFARSRQSPRWKQYRELGGWPCHA